MLDLALAWRYLLRFSMVPGNNAAAGLPTTPGMRPVMADLACIARVARGGPGYPARLVGIPRPPAELWFSGALPVPGAPAVAIVGSRAASGAGCARARELAAALGRRGLAVVSGGAFGIDAAGHEGALAAGAQTYAVLGCGVDVVYPDRHGPLFARIAAQGGLLSELAPGTPPRTRQFPSRNRIIAALADGVLVVEAALRSGALITARLARQRGQRLLAVPGSIGTDALIAAGAAVAVRDAAAVVDGLAGRAAAAVPRVTPERFGALTAALGAGAETPAGLARRLALPLPVVMGLLFEAELEGWVRRAGDGHYEVPRGT